MPEPILQPQAGTWHVAGKKKKKKKGLASTNAGHYGQSVEKRMIKILSLVIKSLKNILAFCTTNSLSGTYPLK